MASFSLIEAASEEPVSLEELKAQARIESDEEDDLLEGLLIAARQWVEAYTGRALLKQAWRLWLDEMPDTDCLLLPKAPLIEVSAMTVFGNDDSSIVWDEANYFVDTASEPGRVVLRSDGAWPEPTRTANGISVDYFVGYGEASTDVPEALRRGILQIAAFWYEHRGDAMQEGLSASVPLLACSLLQPYRIRSWRL